MLPNSKKVVKNPLNQNLLIYGSPPFQMFLDLCATGENEIMLQKWIAVHTNIWSIINRPKVGSQDTDDTEEDLEQHQRDNNNKL